MTPLTLQLWDEVLSAGKPSLGSDLVSWLQTSTPHLLAGSIHEAEDVREAPWSSSQHWGLQAGGQKSCGGGEHVFTHTAPTPALSQVLCEPGLSQALDLPSSCHLLLQP